MRILFVGDVVGRPGRDAVLGLVPRLRDERRLDAIVVNCENVASGRGVTPDIADRLLRSGVDVLTGGNHIWRFKEIESYLEEEPRLVRPANYPNAPGHGSYTLALTGGRTLGVIQIEGRVFMRSLGCPFVAITQELSRLGPVTATLVDLHCEASSEKQALAWHFDGRLSAAIGTHTHVPTADERILPRGTAFLTDAGMTGPYASVIGMDVESSVRRFLTQRQTHHKVAEGDVRLCGAIIDIDDANGHATAIERICVPWKD